MIVLLDLALALLVFVGCAVLGLLVALLIKELNKPKVEKTEDKQDR